MWLGCGSDVFSDVVGKAWQKFREGGSQQLALHRRKVNNQYFPKWMGPLYIGVYIATQAGLVFDGELSLGTFLVATLVAHSAMIGDTVRVF